LDSLCNDLKIFEMKKNLLISLKLTLVMIILCSVIYPLLIAGIGKAALGGGKGETVSANGKVVGYELIGQKFTDNKYFWGRPSAVDYNAAGSAGSNKGPSNPDYLKIVQDRIDSFLVHNPGVKKEEIPADLVTASSSGLDPDISPASAYVQVKRIATVRNLPEAKIKALVDQHIAKPFAGLAPEKVNVLKLNIDLDKLSAQ
jgi:K+-transporting ATPase ATPase C chain